MTLHPETVPTDGIPVFGRTLRTLPCDNGFRPATCITMHGVSTPVRESLEWSGSAVFPLYLCCFADILVWRNSICWIVADALKKEDGMGLDVNFLIPVVTFLVIAGWIGIVVLAEYMTTAR
jgi:hypothetical protein